MMLKKLAVKEYTTAPVIPLDSDKEIIDMVSNNTSIAFSKPLPIKLTNLHSKPLNKIPVLKCTKCKEDLGTPYIYKKENRKSFRLYQDALIKKLEN